MLYNKFFRAPIRTKTTSLEELEAELQDLLTKSEEETKLIGHVSESTISEIFSTQQKIIDLEDALYEAIYEDDLQQ